jgi:pyruvate dehydrogenase E1 component alpha subunit
MNKEDQIKIYKYLSLIRKTQEEIVDRYHPADKMKCPMHFCIGQEMTPAVLNPLMIKEDSIYSHHRSHGYFISKKGPIREMIAEFYGKITGTNGGLAGSQELSSSKINFYSGTILSGAFAMALGDAYEKNYNKKKGIAISVIGDGGMEEGIVYEALNMASLMKLPILFICENNKYSTHTTLPQRTLEHNPIHKVKNFNIDTSYFNSNDPDKLYDLMNKIIKKIRKTKKPHFIEVNTYRFNGHVGPEGDDHFNYRSKKEIKSWIAKDPLKFYEKKLLKKIKNFSKFKNKIDKENLKTIDEAFEFAEKSDFPKEYQSNNFKGTYKNVKEFYDNNISFGLIQEGHKPKPY